MLQPGGLISLLFANPYADALRWVLARGDLEKARLALREQASSADLFGLPHRAFMVGLVQEALTDDCNLNCTHCYRPTDQIYCLALEEVKQEKAYFFPAVNDAEYVFLDVTSPSYPVTVWAKSRSQRLATKDTG